MKVLSRDFTTKEKILILILCIILLGLAYYQFVDKPVRSAVKQAEAQQSALEAELQTARIKLAQLEAMQNDIDEAMSRATFAPMPSYNNSKQVNALLNDILGDLDYAISFSNVTQSGDQVRRSISLSFTAPDYLTVEDVLTQLANAPFRCLVGNVSCGIGISRDSKVLNVSLTATFYETMVGGEADAGLSA